MKKMTSKKAAPIHGPAYTKGGKGMGWGVGEHRRCLGTATSLLPLGPNEVQGVGFGIVFHVLLAVHQPAEDDELPPAAHHRVQAGLGWPHH